MKTPNNIPLKKSCNRQRRLTLSVKWMKTYNGGNLIKGYAKNFGVDKLCAIKELEMLGVEISEERKNQIKTAINNISNNDKKKKEDKEKNESNVFESNEYFSFIAGYTSGGVPFGTIWEEQDDEFMIEVE